MIIWVIGLAGSGKTTIGRAVHERLHARRPATVFLDGDDVRDIMGGDLGHSREDRYRNAWRIARLCRYLDHQGVDVVCAILSIFQEHRDWCREQATRYFEIFIDVDMEVLAGRDQKGLYSSAVAGRVTDVVGIDMAWDRPTRADVVIENSKPRHSFREVAAQIVDAIDAGRPSA